jgi:hypothetical protein
MPTRSEDRTGKGSTIIKVQRYPTCGTLLADLPVSLGRRRRGGDSPGVPAPAPDPAALWRQEPRPHRPAELLGRRNELRRLVSIYVQRLGMTWPVLHGMLPLPDLGKRGRMYRGRGSGRRGLGWVRHSGAGEDRQHEGQDGNERRFADHVFIISRRGGRNMFLLRAAAAWRVPHVPEDTRRG